MQDRAPSCPNHVHSLQKDILQHIFTVCHAKRSFERGLSLSDPKLDLESISMNLFKGSNRAVVSDSLLLRLRPVSLEYKAISPKRNSKNKPLRRFGVSRGKSGELRRRVKTLFCSALHNMKLALCSSSSGITICRGHSFVLLLQLWDIMTDRSNNKTKRRKKKV